MIANPPAFRSGKKPLGACAMKYATAMSPARMNATGRVNKPSTISTPPTISIMPLMPERDVGATPVICETGKLRYFDVPCSRNSRPTMMRKILRTRGDHVARKLSIAGIIIPPVDALRSWHTIRDHALSDVNISGLANGALGEHRRHDTDGIRLEIDAPGCWSSVRKSTEPTAHTPGTVAQGRMKDQAGAFRLRRTRHGPPTLWMRAHSSSAPARVCAPIRT